MSAERLRVLHCPTTVGGNAHSLSRAERAFGCESHSMALLQNHLNYPVDEVVMTGRRTSLLNEIRRWRAVRRSLRNYDVLHYNFGQSLAPMRVYPRKRNILGSIAAKFYNALYAGWAEMLDVWFARKMNKVVVVTYQGDDARQGAYCQENYSIHFCRDVDEDYYNEGSDRIKREQISRFDRYADFIYAVNPDLLNVLPSRARFVPYASVDPREWTPVWPTDQGLALPHVVHAPSHQAVKGTRYIVKALEKLKEEGVPFRYTLVENMPNDEARKIYETADILVDQLLAGYYGGLSVELMSLGKPVISYLRESDMHHLPEKMWADMPVINATPDTIYDVLKLWLTDRKAEIPQLGRQCRAYVEEWHDPLKIAQSIVQDYKSALHDKKNREHVICAA